MKKVLLVFIVLVMVASASASTYWSGGTSGDWEVVGNWLLSDNVTAQLPTSSQDTKIGDASKTAYVPNATINLASPADSRKLYVYEGTLNLNSGANLVVDYAYAYVGYNNGNTNGIGILNVNTGAHLAISGPGDDMRIGKYGGNGTVNLNGGTIDITNKMYIGYDGGAAARVNINSGIATIGRLYMHNDGPAYGILNVENGTLIIDDDEAKGQTYWEDYIDGYIASSNIIAFDGAGSIVRTWVNDTMEITAIPEPMTLSLLGLGGLALLRRRRA